MRNALLISMLLTALVSTDEPLRIRLAANFVAPGGDQRVTCSVARNPDNRKLVLGVEFERSSDVDLVANPWVTHELWVRKVTCDAGEAFCEVTDNLGKRTRRQLAFQMPACENRSSGFPEE